MSEVWPAWSQTRSDQELLSLDFSAIDYMKLMHALWVEKDGDGQTFCLAGPLGEEARKLLGPDAKLVWTVEASSHFEAMTAYYQFMGWGQYTTDQAWDAEPYPKEWFKG
jgi:hypothetical protein